MSINNIFRKNKSVLLFVISLIACYKFLAPAIAATIVNEPELDLKYFRFQKLNQDQPPCDSLECRLIWAAAASALGDYGEYARRIKADGMAEYAKSSGSTQNFSVWQPLELLPQIKPYYVTDNLKIAIKNFDAIKERSAGDVRVEARPIIEIRINDVPLDVFLDSGAGLRVPKNSAAAKTLDELPGFVMKSPSAVGNIGMASFGVVNELSIGKLTLFNTGAQMEPPKTINNIPTPEIGLLGFPLLLRSNAVTIDLKNGFVEVNPNSIKESNCVPMELVLDKNKMIAGIAANVLIDGSVVKARVDTGGNTDMLIHGSNSFSTKKFQAIEGVWIIDSAGKFSPIESAKVNVTVGSDSSEHEAHRIPVPNENFDVTLGIKFFTGRSFTFNFEQRQFCMGE